MSLGSAPTDLRWSRVTSASPSQATKSLHWSDPPGPNRSGFSSQVNRNRYRALDRGYALKARCHEKPVKGPSHWEEIMIHSKRGGRSPSHDYVAGNGLINRRALLGKGIAIAGAAGAAGSINGAAADPLVDEPWSLEFGSVVPPVQTPSPFEKDVVRSLSNP